MPSNGPGVRRRRVVLAAAVTSVALCGTSLVVVLGAAPVTAENLALHESLTVHGDRGLPTWWSSSLLTAGVLLHVAAWLAARVAGAPAARYWLAGAGLLAVLSLTEYSGLHDRLDGAARQLFGVSAWTESWIPLGAVTALGLLALFGWVAAGIAGRAGRLLLVGAGLVLSCALVGEWLHALLAARSEVGSALAYHLGELGENAGAILLLAAAGRLLTVTREPAGLRVRYRIDASAAAPVDVPPVPVAAQR